MKNKLWTLIGLLTLTLFLAIPVSAADRDRVAEAATRLEGRAAAFAEEMFSHFRGWRNEISDAEQVILFKSETFAASCRLFSRLSGGNSDYFSADYLRTNLYNAFQILIRSYQELEDAMRQTGLRTSILYDCRRVMDDIDRQFSRWPSSDNLSYLDGKYVKANDRTVYLIERKATGVYVRRPFPNMESLWRYNYHQKRDKNPWKYLVEVARQTLEKMPEERAIHLTFEGCMVMDLVGGNKRAVYLIRAGKKCVIPSFQILDRCGGWKKVYEVPGEVIASYPDGDVVQ